MKHPTLIVSGKIQKAGYREKVIDIGKSLGLSGYAENLPGEFSGFSKLVKGGERDERLDTAAILLKELIVVTRNGFSSIKEDTSAMLVKQDKMLEKQDLHIEITRNGFNDVKNEIYIWYPGDNYFYDNYFNNRNNSYFLYSTHANFWNTKKTPGINIVGGPYMGGNFWANPSGTGFSQTCTDADKDGICDAQYTLDSNNIDYLPLALVTAGVKGDLNGNGQSADAGDLVLMKRASIGEINL